jgi:hypothetical protein
MSKSTPREYVEKVEADNKRLRKALERIVALEYDHVSMVDVARNTLEGVEDEDKS